MYKNGAKKPVVKNTILRQRKHGQPKSTKSAKLQTVELASCGESILKKLITRLSKVPENKLTASVVQQTLVSVGFKKVRHQDGHILGRVGNLELKTTFKKVKEEMQKTPEFLADNKQELVASATA